MRNLESRYNMEAIKLLSFFERDLNKLVTEIELYKEEKNLWLVEGNISNSAGNLALHLIGNLNTFIGKELGNTEYLRDRDLEFSAKDVPRAHIITGIKDTITMLKNVLSQLTTEDLAKDYPVLKFPEPASTEYLLIHLAAHLTYHLGQINYHRRLLDK